MTAFNLTEHGSKFPTFYSKLNTFRAKVLSFLRVELIFLMTELSFTLRLVVQLFIQRILTLQLDILIIVIVTKSFQSSRFGW